MQIGRPTIVSATGSYLDAPEEQVLRVAPGPTDPRELAAAIRMLADDPDRRERMGQAARTRMEHVRETDATARGYEEAIEQTLELVRDPARKAYARWSAGLADIGVDEALVARGYGASYAHAMESFKRTS
jgi:hypothetical protein